jgi:hypothetical protein
VASNRSATAKYAGQSEPGVAALTGGGAPAPVSVGRSWIACTAGRSAGPLTNARACSHACGVASLSLRAFRGAASGAITSQPPAAPPGMRGPRMKLLPVCMSMIWTDK